ncbi:MAG: hypothetical protein AAFV43_04415 [Planctomycetota bacterium]
MSEAKPNRHAVGWPFFAGVLVVAAVAILAVVALSPSLRTIGQRSQLAILQEDYERAKSENAGGDLFAFEREWADRFDAAAKGLTLSDPLAFSTLSEAAKLHEATGDRVKADRLFERAAEAAMAAESPVMADSLLAALASEYRSTDLNRYAEGCAIRIEFLREQLADAPTESEQADWQARLQNALYDEGDRRFVRARNEMRQTDDESERAALLSHVAGAADRLEECLRIGDAERASLGSYSLDQRLWKLGNARMLLGDADAAFECFGRLLNAERGEFARILIVDRYAKAKWGYDTIEYCEFVEPELAKAPGDEPLGIAQRVAWGYQRCEAWDRAIPVLEFMIERSSDRNAIAQAMSSIATSHFALGDEERGLGVLEFIVSEYGDTAIGPIASADLGQRLAVKRERDAPAD